MLTVLSKFIICSEKLIIRYVFQIHCGNDIYMSMNSYNNAVNAAAKQEKLDKPFSSSSAFVREVSMTIVGAAQLKKCSVTGRKCNRLNTAPKEKLDPKLLGAIYGKKNIMNRGKGNGPVYKISTSFFHKLNHENQKVKKRIKTKIIFSKMLN